MKRAAIDATLRAIVEVNPRDIAELLAIEGVSEMLADVAGRELLDMLRKA